MTFWSCDVSVCHHTTLGASSIPPLHLLGQYDQNEVQQEFSVILHWHHQHGMRTALSRAPFHSLGQTENDLTFLHKCTKIQ